MQTSPTVHYVILCTGYIHRVKKDTFAGINVFAFEANYMFSLSTGVVQMCCASYSISFASLGF